MPEMPTNPERMLERITKGLQEVGVYEDLTVGGLQWTSEGYLIGQMIVGKVAFSARVQNPETFDFNQEFQRMIAGEQNVPSPDALKSLDELIRKTSKRPKGES